MVNCFDQIDVSPKDVILFAGLYNDCVKQKHSPFINLTISKNITNEKWYTDIVNSIRLTISLKAKPRDFIIAQLTEYKKPFKKARDFPTFKMLSSPSAIDRWNSYCIKKGTMINPNLLTDKQIMDFNDQQLRSIMESNEIKTEEEFFKDPYLVIQLSKNYVMGHPVFQKLAIEEFYKKTYDIATGELFND